MAAARIQVDGAENDTASPNVYAPALGPVRAFGHDHLDGPDTKVCDPGEMLPHDLRKEPRYISIDNVQIAPSRHAFAPFQANGVDRRTDVSSSRIAKYTRKLMLQRSSRYRSLRGIVDSDF